MNPKLYTLFFILTTALFFSCKSASKLYEKGHYDEAVDLSVKKLQKDPGDPKLLDVLRNSYQFAVEDHEARIRNHEASNNELKWEWIYGEYAALQHLYESIRRSPEAFRSVKPTDYSTFLVTHREKAGAARFNRGLALMERDDRESFRQAYREFQSALVYLPGDIEVTRKMEEAYENAVVNIVVLPLEERGSYQYSSYSNRYRGFDNNILRYLQQHNSNSFVRYFTPTEARNRNLHPDYIVDVRFTSINVGRSYDENESRVVSKDVVVKETVYKPDSIVKQYQKVYAKITTTKRTMRSEGLMKVIIRDGDNQSLWTETYNGQHFWSTVFASFTGDNRALSESDIQLVNQTQQKPPADDLIIRSIMDEVQSKMQCGVRDYFAREN